MSHHKHKQALLTRLRELDARLVGIGEELEAPHSRDWEELAVEREGDEVLERLGESGQHEAQRIFAALKRLSEGSYGVCLSCGEPISEARLDVLPEAPLCRDCAAEAAA